MKIDILKDKKHLASIVIIIILLIISYISIKKNENENENFFIENTTPNTTTSANINFNGLLNTNTTKNSIEIGSVGSQPWGVCNMTISQNNKWTDNTKWIGGDSTWTNGLNKGKYYFTKTITIIDPTKIKNAVFYIVPNDECNVYLNNVKINTMFIIGGWGDNKIANLVNIPNNNFVVGINQFMIEYINKENISKTSGLLANLVITYTNNNNIDIHKTDNSWLYYGNIRPTPIINQMPTTPNNINFLESGLRESYNILNTSRFATLDNQDRINSLDKRIHKITKELANMNTKNNKTPKTLSFY